MGEVTLSQVDPLSVDLTMFPVVSPATKISFPKVTPLRRSAVDDVTLSKDDPLSVDNTIFPELTTPKNTVSYTHLTLPTNREV